MSNVIPRIACVALVILAACDGDTGPGGVAGPPGDVAGAYAATSFTLTQGGPEEDLLAQGSAITLTLLTGGTTTGHMFVPAGPISTKTSTARGLRPTMSSGWSTRPIPSCETSIWSCRATN